MEPGIEKMMELAKMERMRARLPPPEDVAAAFRDFFRHKEKTDQAVHDNQAQLALQSLRYCLASSQERSGRGESNDNLLSNSTLDLASRQLRRDSDRFTEAHVNLAEALYSVLIAENRSRVRTALHTYVLALCATGSVEKARNLVVEYEQQMDTPAQAAMEDAPVQEQEDVEETIETRSADGQSPSRVLLSPWLWILRGFAVDGNEAQVDATLTMIHHRGLSEQRDVSSIMLNFSLQRDDLQAIQKWWSEYYRLASKVPSRKAPAGTMGDHTAKVLKWCLANNELEVGHGFVRDVMASNPPKSVWDAIFIWAAGTKKSVDEIDRMMSVMEKSNETIKDRTPARIPDIVTINGLVEYAISREDPYMAERFISLGRERNLEPNARTYILQMNYRLSVDDVDGALGAYKNLQAMDLSSNEDVPAVNRLMVALCKTHRHDFDTIMNAAADLSDRHVRFEPLTVSTLSLLHFNRDEYHDVVDLLNTHAFHYSSTERESIRNAIVHFCLDPSVPTSRAWSAYTILRGIFDETPRSQRTELMTSFFKRERADMGVHIFQNMRQHSRADTIPTVDTYVSAFMGIAKLRDLETLEVVHNQLKLDFNINVTTYLYNALMIGYTACGQPRKALGFWNDIVASREGPSYNSIHVALRACEKSPFGDLKAKKIWDMLRQRGVELDQPLWASYLGALTGNGDNASAFTIIDEALEKGELEINAFALGSLFNGSSGQSKKAEIESWAKERYPLEWQQVESTGVDSDFNGMRTFRLDRSVTP